MTTKEDIIKLQLKTDIQDLKEDEAAGLSQEDLDKSMAIILDKARRYGLEKQVLDEIL